MSGMNFPTFELQEIYHKLVDLDFVRKPSSVQEVTTSVDFGGRKFTDAMRRYVASKCPIVSIKDDNLFDIELDPINQFYVIATPSKVLFVDNQGFSYPRYAIELRGFDNVNY